MSAPATARLALAAALFAATLAQAGGPLGSCNGTPVKYPGAGAITLNYDRGDLGARTKDQADAIITAAASLWTNVPTATVTIARGTDLPVDVTVSNYTTYFNRDNDGLNPVIYDSDGSIVDAIFGVGQKNRILGIAGSTYSVGATCEYLEGHALINGSFGATDATMTVLIAHELGHLIGLDHTQLDSAQGLAPSNYPLMYPFPYRTLATLHHDDASAVTALYPDTNLNGTYGALTGNFRLADGVTPVLGANIWAQDVSNGSRVFSSVSDHLMQNTGFFKMLLPPGTYTLHAEAIQSDFHGGSSVGPYSERYPADPSFQPPMYSGSTPRAPVTLGNGTPVRFAISAGCAANASFRLDGTGSVTGNCSTPAMSTDPPRLASISTRMRVMTGSDVIIGGFIIDGASAKTVVVRARGPSLVAAGITDPLADPMLELVRASDGAVIAANDNWATAANAAELNATGFAPGNGLEAAVMMTLAPGAYTVIVSGVNGGTGVGIAEVYEIDHPDVPLVGISTRGQVLTGNNVMIGGFVIQGSGPQTVVVRARGPSLVAAGIPNALSNPALQLVRASDNTTVATNDDWGSAANAAQIQSSGFAPSNALESAILVTLNPGAYTAIVSGMGGVTGVGIVEVFAVP